MKFAPVALLLSLTLCAAAQKTFQDPANLRGERVAPLTGRELPVDQGASGLEQMLRKLNTTASLMLIDAHPDDEDGGMLTLYSRGMGANVALMTLNRGEGGQNAMTGDFEDALGLLRTQELLEADRYYGVEQMFGTEVDFGFSKTKEESFEKWGHERVLYDVVRAIRLYRPQVIASVFVGGVTDGHGQHQVSGEITQEAFKAAGDPKVFPELTAEGILPWQPLKVYARVPRGAITDKGLFDYATGHYTPARFVNYVTGKVATTTPSVDVMVHEGKTDPLLAEADGANRIPRSYVQFARIGLGMQKSQIGPGMRLPRAGGAYDVGYHLYGSRVSAANSSENAGTFFSGIDTSVMGIQALAPDAPALLRTDLGEIAALLAKAQHDFNPADTEAITPILFLAEMKVSRLIGSVEFGQGPKEVTLPPGEEVWRSVPAREAANVAHELAVKQSQITEAIRLSLGLKLSATAAVPHGDVVAGSTVAVKVRVTTTASEPIKVMDNGSGRYNPNQAPLTRTSPLQLTVTYGPKITSTITRPYFTRKSIEQPYYDLLQPTLRSAPETPAALGVTVMLSDRGHVVPLECVVNDGTQPVEIVPASSVALSSHAEVLPNSKSVLTVGMSEAPLEAKVVAESLGAPGWEGFPVATASSVPGYTDYRVTAPPVPRAETTLHASSKLANGHTYSEGYRAVGYGDLPRTNYYTPATDRVVPVDLKLPARRRIGYLEGTGDAVPEALASIGLAPVMLKVSDLTAAKLAGFDTVILGVRAYNAHPELHGAPTAALLAFARGGGNVVVQYQTGEFTGADAPYPLTLGYQAEKVVVEGDPVKLLKPEAALLREPNAITAADFDGWIEERGHGFLGSWDPRYEALTEVHDPEQAPQEGGLVTAKVGKGRWTYCAFALYRQLPEAVPGAYRLFVNLLGR